MRHDPERAYAFARGPNEKLWTDPSAVDLQASISGHERNHIFMSDGGRAFTDVSLVSGFDDPRDGRVAVLLDYDRDGWTDLAVANANAPRFQLFRNQIGAVEGASGARFVALRFVGGNDTASPSTDWSHRDAYGARVEATVAGRRLIREHRAGEGFAGQNSHTMLLGLGTADAVEGLTVRFPSGVTVTTEAIAAGSLVTVYERSGQDGAGIGTVTVDPYRADRAAAQPRIEEPAPTVPNGATAFPLAQVVASLPAGTTPPRLHMFTTMATWCPSCRGELPQIARLREAFGPDELGLYAVPVDAEDDAAKLARYVASERPSYDLLTDLPAERIAEVKAEALAAFPRDVLPTTLITDAEGRIVRVMAGTPMISDIRRLLAGFTRNGDQR